MRRLLVPLLAFTALTSGCAFHSTATHWNGRVGPNGEPVFVKSTSCVGFNLFVLIKLVGGTNIDGMIDEMTGGRGRRPRPRDPVTGTASPLHLDRHAGDHHRGSRLRALGGAACRGGSGTAGD